MLDRDLEVDDEFLEWESTNFDEDWESVEPTPRELEVATHNYECFVYGEPENRITLRKQCPT